jgi:hypothetical protein
VDPIELEGLKATISTFPQIAFRDRPAKALELLAKYMVPAAVKHLASLVERKTSESQKMMLIEHQRRIARA